MSSTGTYVTNGSCTNIPANAVYYNNGASYALVNAPFNTTLSAYYASSPLANTCQYACASGYSWNGSACLISSVNGACTGIPSNAIYYNGTTSYTLSGAANGTSLTANYNAGAITSNTCQFNCSGGYSWNGSACILNTLTVTCAGTNVIQTSHKCEFDYAGSTQTITISGAGGTLTVNGWGAGGGSWNGTGGGGAAGTLSLPVNAGDSVNVYVGQGGGGTISNPGGNGGGATYVMKGSIPMLVLGGGGGGGDYGGGGAS